MVVSPSPLHSCNPLKNAAYISLLNLRPCFSNSTNSPSVNSPFSHFSNASSGFRILDISNIGVDKACVDSGRDTTGVGPFISLVFTKPFFVAFIPIFSLLYSNISESSLNCTFPPLCIGSPPFF